MQSEQQTQNPYVGPRPFQYTPQDMARFFGRAREMRDIVSLIIAQRTLLLYGKSGTGKSSLVNAAIIPELLNREFEVILPTARVQGVTATDIDLNAIHIRNIFMYNALASWSNDIQSARNLAITTLADFLEAHPTQPNKDDERTLRIVIFDQFEELFTSYPRRWPDRGAFFQQVADALEADSLLRVVFVMREDYIAELERYATLLPGSLRTTYRLESLRREQALLAVTRPLVTTSRSFGEGAAETLIDELLTIGTDRESAVIFVREEYIEPVVLQVVCENMWRMLANDIHVIQVETVRHYAKVNDALLRFYEICVRETADRSGVAEHQIREWFESKLITASQTRGTVSQGSSDTGGLLNSAVAILENQHLIRGDDRAGARWFELAHDRFIEPIRESNRRNNPELIRQQRQLERQRSLLRLLMLIIILLIVLVGSAFGFVITQYNQVINQNEQRIMALADYTPPFQSVQILDINGDNIAELNNATGGARTDVPLSRISPFIIHAVISLETPQFFDNPGVDWLKVSRVFYQNLLTGSVESGTRNITESLAEQLVLQQSRVTAELKWQEAVVANELALRFNQNALLELYLNEIFFGNQAYGVEAAAQFYFGHSANDLNLPESALLAGMIASPVIYNPVRIGGEDLITYNARREVTFDRMDFVIQRMVEVGCLPLPGQPPSGFCVDANVVRQSVIEKANIVATHYEPREVRFRYPHFVYYVRNLVIQTFGEDVMFRRGFVIKTTLNPDIQDAAETALRNQIASLAATGISTGSVMVTDPRTGAIRAMVGSPDFNNEDIDGQVNGALIWQQPGSAIKPIVYTGALEGLDRNDDGVLDYLTPASILWDVPTTFQPNYNPVNFDGDFVGPIAVRYALQNSRNIPAVKAYEFIGADKFRDLATRMGLTFMENASLGLATGLGTTEVKLYDMMAAYGTLANNGVRAPLFAIESITDAQGQPVMLPERTLTQAIQPQLAFLMQNILSDDNARAPAFPLNGPLTIQGVSVAAKTGTTDGTRDLWTMGFTRNAVVGVWLGRPDDARTFVQGGGYNNVAPLWNEVMRAALGTMPRPEGFNAPTNGTVIQSNICTDTGTFPPSTCHSARPEFFLANQPPPPASAAPFQSIAIDSWTGLRANEFCPDNAIQSIFSVLNDASAVDWLKSPSGRATSQRLGLTTGTVDAAPTAECDINTDVPIARILSPIVGQTIGGVVQITGAATAGTFNRYHLEIAPATDSNNFQIIDGPITTPITSGGLLGTFNTLLLPNGSYVLRLAMFSSIGGFAYRTAQVNVNNFQISTPIPFIDETPAISPTPPPTASPLAPLELTATAMAQAATQAVSSGLDPIYITATFIVDRATATEGYRQTATAAGPIITVTPSPSGATVTSQPIARSDCTHVVQRGETYFRIGLFYGLSVTELAAANNIQNINLLYLGQILVIPGCGTTGAVPPQITPTHSASVQAAQLGENHGLVGGDSLGQTWVYNGQIGDVMSIRVVANEPVVGDKNAIPELGRLDPIVVVNTSAGAIAVGDDISSDNRNAEISKLLLPATGQYQIEVRSFAGLSSGEYTLYLEVIHASAVPTSDDVMD